LRLCFPARPLPKLLQSDAAQEAGHGRQREKRRFHQSFIGARFQLFSPEDDRQLRALAINVMLPI
jgi:hypothetical protein